MEAEAWFETDENKALLAICSRKMIKTAGIGAIIWGGLNLFIGMAAIQVSIINAPILAIALLMLTSGILALARPQHSISLLMAVVSLVLLIWNLGITVLNLMAGESDPAGLFTVGIPLLITIAFFRQYKQLKPIAGLISAITPAQVKQSTQLCKTLYGKKLKQEANVVQASSGKCRIQLMPEQVLCVQKNLARAFIMTRGQFHTALADPGAKRLKMSVRHPLGKLTYSFDKKNSEKLRDWLASGASVEEPENPTDATAT